MNGDFTRKILFCGFFVSGGGFLYLMIVSLYCEIQCIHLDN